MKRTQIVLVACMGIMASVAQAQPVPQGAAATVAATGERAGDVESKVAPAAVQSPPANGQVASQLGYVVPPNAPQPKLRDGLLLVERRTRLGNPALWGTGLALFLATPLVTSLGIDGGSGLRTGTVFVMPIFGMFLCAREEVRGEAYDKERAREESGRAAGWAVAGLVQASGFAMLIVGVAVAPEKVERFPLRFSAAPTKNGGMDFGMSGRF